MIVTRVLGSSWGDCVSSCSGCSLPLVIPVERERELVPVYCSDCMAAGLDEVAANAAAEKGKKRP